MKSVRPWLTRIHRWTGLALVLFLLVVGFTGALLPFQHDIQEWLAPTPDRTVAAPHPGARAIEDVALLRIAEQRSGGVVSDMSLERAPGDPATFSIRAPTGKPPLAADTITLDPYTGRELPSVDPSAPQPARARIMPFLYDLHMSLALGDWGRWVLGMAALAWTIDCFVGVWLTLPAPRRGWWRRWRQAWKLRLPPRTAFRFNFNVHRAAGLWLWPMLFIFAWSSVGMNLTPAYEAVMGAVSDYQPWGRAPPVRRSSAPVMAWEDALPIARRSVVEEGRRRGFTVERERGITIDREGGTITYVVRTSRDRSENYANSWFTLDARTGKVIHSELPTGEHGGNTFGYWLGILHTAGVGGLPYRILVSLTGIAIVALSITGIAIWMRKRSARKIHKRKAEGRPARAPAARVLPRRRRAV